MREVILAFFQLEILGQFSQSTGEQLEGIFNGQQAGVSALNLLTHFQGDYLTVTNDWGKLQPRFRMGQQGGKGENGVITGSNKCSYRSSCDGL